MISLGLPFNVILFSLFTGFFIAIIYLGLLWITLKHLNRTKHKVALLFISAIVRLGLFLFLTIIFSQHNPARFLWIVFAFIITRLILVSMVKLRRKK